MAGLSLYDDDVVTWSEQQSTALRALAGRPDLSNVLDWTNVIEEIEALGRSEWRGVESQICNALRHILKGFCDPGSLSTQAWSIETDTFLDVARGDYRASMRRLIDVDRAWTGAFRQAMRELRPYSVRIPPGIPSRSPFSLEDLLDPAFTYDAAVRSLHAAGRTVPKHSGDMP